MFKETKYSRRKIVIKLAEECNELSQVACKVILKQQWKPKKLSESLKQRLYEEIAHVMYFIDLITEALNLDEDEIQKEYQKKREQKKEEKNNA